MTHETITTKSSIFIPKQNLTIVIAIIYEIFALTFKACLANFVHHQTRGKEMKIVSTVVGLYFIQKAHNLKKVEGSRP
jgi:hypothetical protein